jgi:anti-anti-sigma factor
MSNVEETRERVVVRPGRDIVSSMVGEFRAELKAIVDKQDVLLTVDLEGVRMIDSMGLGVLIATHNSLVKRDAGLELINISGDILLLLKNMRLDRHFSLR